MARGTPSSLPHANSKTKTSDLFLSVTEPSVPAWKIWQPAPPNIRFLPFFPSSDIPSVLAAPDAHIVTIKRGLEGVVVPSKMFGIIAAGKPIVAVAARETDVAALGLRHGFAICADPTSPDELASSVRRIAADPGRPGRHEPGRPRSSNQIFPRQ